MNVREFLETRKFPGKVIFAKLWGSRSHNTHLPGSDEDFLVVYQAPTKDLLSLHPPPESMDNAEGVKPDFQAHELKKFCDLLLKGNPALIEMLYTDRATYAASEWAELTVHRKEFLTQTAVKQYLGYAEGQLKRLANHGGKGGLHTKGGSYNEKWAYHIVRLLWDAKRIARGEEPVVWKEGLERDQLMHIREGLLSQNAVEQIAREEITAIDALKPWKIPETANEDLLNRWLLNLRGFGER